MPQIIPIKRPVFAVGPIAVILLVSAFLFFFRLGERPLRNPDEGRYAEIAREMVVSNDWLEPTLYHTDYLRKPVLFYWLLASSFKLFGQSEFSARLVPAIFGLLGVLGTYFFTRRYFGKERAFFSSLLLATNPFYLEVSRYLLIDSVFAFFLVCTFYLAYHAIQERRQMYVLGFYLSLALGVMTKGVAGAAVPAFGILIYLALSGQIKAGAKRLLSIKGIVLFLAVALPWFIAISIHEPEFLRFFFLHEHISRYLSSGFEHQESWYFYVVLLPLVFFPWGVFAEPLKIASNLKRDESKAVKFYLQVIFLSTLLFYSISHSKLVTYLMPIIPLGSILLGDAWVVWMERDESGHKLRRSNLLSIVLAILLISSVGFVLLSPLFGFSFPGKIPEGVRVYVFLAAVLTVVQSGALIITMFRNDRKHLLYSWIIFLSLASILTTFTMESINRNYTTKHFAEVLAPKMTKNDNVYIYGQPSAFYDFAFYLNRPVKLVGLEGELEFNMDDYRLGDDRAAVVMPDEWKSLIGKEKMYCVMRKSDYEELDGSIRQKLTILAKDERKLLVESFPA